MNFHFHNPITFENRLSTNLKDLKEIKTSNIINHEVATQVTFTCSKSAISNRSGVFIVNFERILHLFLVFLLLTLNK